MVRRFRMDSAAGERFPANGPLPHNRAMKFCSHCGSDRIELRVPDGDNLPRHVCAGCGDDPLPQPEDRRRLPARVGGSGAALPPGDRTPARAVDAARRLPRARRDGRRGRAARDARGGQCPGPPGRALRRHQPRPDRSGLHDVPLPPRGPRFRARDRRVSRCGCFARRRFRGRISRSAPSRGRCATISSTAGWGAFRCGSAHWNASRRAGRYLQHVHYLDQTRATSVARGRISSRPISPNRGCGSMNSTCPRRPAGR